MKKLEIIIRQEKMEVLKKVLNDLGVNGMTVSNVLGCGNQKGNTEYYRGAEVKVTLLNKIKAEVVIKDEIVDKVIAEVRNTINTGKVGDGKIFVIPVENAVRIRTGEIGETAI